MDHALRPLTERILERLRGRKVVWISLWACVPWLNAGANLLLGSTRTSDVWDQSDLLIVLNYAAISFAILVSLWGAGRIARRLETLRTTRADALAAQRRALFRGINGAIGPLLLSAAAALIFGISTLITDGWVPALIRGGTWVVIGIPMFGYLWTYGCLLVGLDRLGRERLVPDPVHVDPGLGLQPLGSIASTGLWMLLVWLVPILLTALSDVVGAVIGFIVLIGVIATFFLSVLRLHWRMSEVKAGELALARDLYAQAYEPVHQERSLDALDRQQALLGAADALEKRASAIHEWPFAERTPTLVLTVVTSVIAMTVGRLILDPFGL